MSLRKLASQNIVDRQRLARPVSIPQRHTGHAHFWERAAIVSRRGFLGAAAAGIALPSISGSSLSTLPKPIPGGLDLLGNGHNFHVFLPGTSPELSTITDFNGVLGATDVLGSWNGPVPNPNNLPLIFDADMRFMSGEYIARDGRHRQGLFAFV